jgi:hypothetical protein
MGTWTNNDGLYIKYGQTEVTPTIGGVIDFDGFQRIEFELDLTTLTSSAAVLMDNVVIPDNSQIVSIEVIVTEVTAGTNSNLNIGLMKTDRTTEIDNDGLIAAGDAWHTSAKGTRLRYDVGTTEAGAILGTTITDPALIVGYYDTGAFTDGTLRVTIDFTQAS